MLSITKINKKILIIISVLLLYGPEFRFLPHYTWALAAVAAMIVCLYKGFARKFGIISNCTYFVFFALLMNIVWSLVTTGINGTEDYSYITFLVGTILTVIRSFLLVYVIYRASFEWEKTTDVYFETMALSGVIYVLFTIVFIIAPEFKEFWFSNVIFSSTKDYFAYQFRYSLNGFAAFASSTISSIIVLMCAYLLVKNAKNSNWLKYLLYYIINIVGCFFYGRICIFAMGLSVLYIVYFMFNKKLFFKIVVIVVLIAVGLYQLISYLATVNDSFLYWKNWAFAIFEQLFSGNGITDYSVTHMKDDMYFLPELKTLFVGDGQYTLSDGSYYMHTDVGIMRSVLFFGIPGMVINAALVLFPLRKILKLVDDKKLRLLLLFIAIMWLILELKGEAYQRILQMILPIYYVLRYDCVYRYQQCDELAEQEQ